MYAKNSTRSEGAALRLDFNDLKAALLDALTRQGVQFTGEVIMQVVGDASPEDGEVQFSVASGGRIVVGNLVFE